MNPDSSHPGGGVGSSSTVAQFWFDPICPWTWATSKWMREVATMRPVTIEWRMMSLAYLNLVQRADMEASPEFRNPLARQYLEARGWDAIRVCAAAAKEAGDDILGPVYQAVGARVNEQNRRSDPTAFAEAL